MPCSNSYRCKSQTSIMERRSVENYYTWRTRRHYVNTPLTTAGVSCRLEGAARRNRGRFSSRRTPPRGKLQYLWCHLDRRSGALWKFGAHRCHCGGPRGRINNVSQQLEIIHSVNGWSWPGTCSPKTQESEPRDDFVMNSSPDSITPTIRSNIEIGRSAA